MGVVRYVGVVIDIRQFHMVWYIIFIFIQDTFQGLQDSA